MALLHQHGERVGGPVVYGRWSGEECGVWMFGCMDVLVSGCEVSE